MNIQFKSTLILYITFLACLIPLSAFSDEAVIDKPLNVKIDKHIVIQELGERVTTSTSENIPSDIVEAVNNNYPDELDKQLQPWLEWYKQLLGWMPETERTMRIGEGVVLPRYAFIKEVNLTDNELSLKQNEKNLIVIYQIRSSEYQPPWAMTIFKKENNSYKKIWGVIVKDLTDRNFDVNVRKLNGRTEILVSFMSNGGAHICIYEWTNNSATLVGNFTGVIEINNNEIIEGESDRSINYYKWDGTKYTLYKTESDEAIKNILLKAVPQNLIDEEHEIKEKQENRNIYTSGISICTSLNFSSTIRAYAWVESKLDNSEEIYIIALYTVLNKLVVFKRTDNTLTDMWTSKNRVGGMGINVEDLFHDGKREIIIVEAASNMFTNTFIFRWEGTTARFLGSFDDAFDCRWAAVKGGNKLPSGGIQGDEVIEFLCNESKIYKWDGHDYKLVKVVKAVPGTPLFKDGEWQDLFLGGGVNGAIAKLKSLNNQALHLFNKGKIHKAISIWKQALASPVIDIGLPEDAEVYNNLGFAYYKLGKKYYPLAEKYYKEAKETYQWRWSIYLNLGDLYSDMGQNKLATENYEFLLKMKPDYKHADEIKKKIELLRTIN